VHLQKQPTSSMPSGSGGGKKKKKNKDIEE
jgi:hypothetical protein